MTLREVIFLTWGYYRAGQTLQDEVLAMYCDDLSDLDPQACMAAYRAYRRNPANKTFPLPAQIRELVAPGEFIAPEVMARETAARIVGAISKFGWNNSKEAQMYIGPEGWQAVQRQGGWSHMCEQTSKFNELTLQAQLRDQLIGVFKYGAHAIEQSIGISSDRRGELEPVDFKRITDRKNENDKDPA